MTQRTAPSTFAVLALLAACTKTSTPVTIASKPVASTSEVAASQTCVPIRSIREARVRSDKVIDFHMIDGVILRNRIAQGCPQLGFERAFTYSTSLTQLCSVDIITVIVQGGGPRRGASCGLGNFTPIAPETAKNELAATDR